MAFIALTGLVAFALGFLALIDDMLTTQEEEFKRKEREFLRWMGRKTF